MSTKHFYVQSGFTLVELAMALAITSLTVGLVVPTMDQLRSRVHLRGVAAQLETDLQLARTTAVSLNRVVQMSFATTATGSCYVLHSGRPGDCSCDSNGVAHCTTDGEAIRTVHLSAPSGVSVSSNSRNIGFEPLRGMVTPTATIMTQSRSGEQINVVINVMGRVRTCSATPHLGGLPKC